MTGAKRFWSGSTRSGGIQWQSIFSPDNEQENSDRCVPVGQRVPGQGAVPNRRGKPVERDEDTITRSAQVSFGEKEENYGLLSLAETSLTGLPDVKTSVSSILEQDRWTHIGDGKASKNTPHDSFLGNKIAGHCISYGTKDDGRDQSEQEEAYCMSEINGSTSRSTNSIEVAEGDSQLPSCEVIISLRSSKITGGAPGIDSW